MKKRVLFLIGLMLIVLVSCTIPGTVTQTETISTSETPVNSIKSDVYENAAFRFDIPDGWGVTDSEGSHYDLNTEKIVTIHDKNDAKKSVAFFTVSSAKLEEGETVQSRFDEAYKQGPEIEDPIVSSYERDSLRVIDITYGRPWGEPRWIFRDIWLEKDGVVYVLTSQAYPNRFDEYSETFAAIVDSFVLK